MNIKNNLIFFFLLSAFYTPVTYTVRYKSAAIAKMTQQALINLIQTGKPIEVEGSDQAADIQRTRILNLRLELERQASGMGAGMGAGAGAGLGAGMGGGGTGGGMGAGTGTGAGMDGGGAASGTVTGKGAGSGTTANPDESIPTSEEDEKEEAPKKKEVVIKKSQFMKPAGASATNDTSDACIVAALKEIAFEAYVGVSTLKGMETLAALNGLQTGSSSYLYYIKDRLATIAGMNPEFKNQPALATFIGDNEKEPGYIVLADGVNTNKPGSLDNFYAKLYVIAGKDLDEDKLNNISDHINDFYNEFKGLISSLLFNKSLVDQNEAYIQLTVVNIVASQRPIIDYDAVTYNPNKPADTATAGGRSDQLVYELVRTYISKAKASPTNDYFIELLEAINLLRLKVTFLRYQDLIGSRARNLALGQKMALAKFNMYPLLELMLMPKDTGFTPKDYVLNFDKTFTIQLLFNGNQLTNSAEDRKTLSDITRAHIEKGQPSGATTTDIGALIIDGLGDARDIDAVRTLVTKLKEANADTKDLSSLLDITKLEIDYSSVNDAFDTLVSGKLKNNDEASKKATANLEKIITTYNAQNAKKARCLTALKAITMEYNDRFDLNFKEYLKANSISTTSPLVETKRTEFVPPPIDDFIEAELKKIDPSIMPQDKLFGNCKWNEVDRIGSDLLKVFQPVINKDDLARFLKAPSLLLDQKTATEKQPKYKNPVSAFKAFNSYGILYVILNEAITDETAKAKGLEKALEPLLNSLEAVIQGKIETKHYVPAIAQNKELVNTKIYSIPKKADGKIPIVLFAKRMRCSRLCPRT